MKTAPFKCTLLALGAWSLLQAAPARAAEIIFRGSGIAMPRSFLCGEKTMPAGRYDLAAAYEPKPHERTMLLVQKGAKTLCEVPGASSRTQNSLSTKKVRLITRVNSEMRAIELSLVLPESVRSRIPNQVYYLPFSH